MKLQLLSILAFVFAISCSDTAQETKDREKPLSTKENPDTQKTPAGETDTIDIEAASVKADEYYYDGDSASWVSKNLLGCWFVPHNAGINIRLSNDGRFEFDDYNSKIHKSELLKGRFDLQKETLILLYDDRPKQKFSFVMGEYPDSNYYIKNASGYYFVRGSCD